MDFEDFDRMFSAYQRKEVQIIIIIIIIWHQPKKLKLSVHFY